MRTAAPYALALAVLASGLVAGPAHAQLARTFVSAASGNDVNDCNRLTPCRTFQVAHDNTLTSGEITVLDPGGYGAVTITKSISIINDGVGEAGVLVSGGVNGITIAAGGVARINLRGLTVKGIGFGGGNGIVFNNAAFMTIENCVVRGLDGGGSVGNGIVLQPTGASYLAVSKTVVADNAGRGIAVVPTGNNVVRVSLNRIEAYNNVNGILISDVLGTGEIRAHVVDSVAAGNSNIGITVQSTTFMAISNVVVARSVIANNGVGLAADGPGARLHLGRSVVTGNTTSWTDFGGSAVLDSYGDNDINGNNDGDPAPAVISRK